MDSKDRADTETEKGEKTRLLLQRNPYKRGKSRPLTFDEPQSFFFFIIARTHYYGPEVTLALLGSRLMCF